MTVVPDAHDQIPLRWVTIGAMTDETGKVVALSPAPDAIELRHLRAFAAVAGELNFGRAAARLFISQPALSRQIRTLERLLGCELLRRSTHRVELTLAGEALLARTGTVLHELDDAVAAVRSIGGEMAGRMARLWEPFGDLSDELQDLRATFEQLHAQFPVPAEIQVRPVNAGGAPSLLLATDPDQPPTLLYLHGGGYVSGSAFGYRPLVGNLALAAVAATLVPEYRLAPEHPYPAGLEDAIRAYLWLVDSGTAPAAITLAGDSAGAGLVLATLLKLKERGLPQPGAAVLFSPLLDLEMRAQPATVEPQPAVVAFEQLRRYLDAYLAGHEPADEPALRPLTADLSGLPRMLIQAGTGDPLLGDAQRLAEQAIRYGVAAKLDLYPVTTHVFHLFSSFLPEAADAIARAGAFIRSSGTAAGIVGG